MLPAPCFHIADGSFRVVFGVTSHMVEKVLGDINTFARHFPVKVLFQSFSGFVGSIVFAKDYGKSEMLLFKFTLFCFFIHLYNLIYSNSLFVLIICHYVLT